MQILRFAQNDRLSTERSGESAFLCFQEDKCRCFAHHDSVNCSYLLRRGPHSFGLTGLPVEPAGADGCRVHNDEYQNEISTPQIPKRISTHFGLEPP